MYKKVVFIVAIVFVFLFTYSVPTALSSALKAEPPPSVANQQAVTDQVTQAIYGAISSRKSYIQGDIVSKLKVTEVKISQDQQWATAWVVYYEAQVEAFLPTEPGMAVSHLMDNQWRVSLPSDTDWQEIIGLTPEDLLSKTEKDMWVAMNQGEPETVTVQSGYLLPWHGGVTASLSRSVGHDADFSTCHFGFDFYLPGSTVCPGSSGILSGTTGLNFEIYAAKAATVWGWDDSVVNCDHSKVNFIVLRNIDDPTIFQLYMHLAQNSIPQALKTVGAPVARGQLIAVADNTGNSSGSHLHFQVEHQPYWPTANPYWNTALDVTFDDVDINGGRPRNSPLDPPYCREDDICDVFRQTYTSGNYYMGDSTPPTGELTGVSNGELIATDTITLSGSGSDGQTGLDYGQLIGFFNGAWNMLGPQFNPSFTYSWNLCDPSLTIPNGPVSVAMILYDIAGNPAPRAGLHHFIKSYSCPIPPPSCIPGQNQVALFKDPYYAGACAVFNAGNYANGSALNPVGSDEAESIMVGGNVIATIYSGENFAGHSQAVTQNVGYMRYSWVDSNTLSSLKVSIKTAQPAAPILVGPGANSVYRKGDVIPLSWSNGGGAVDYQIEVYLNNSLVRNLPWQTSPAVYVDALDQGNYSWRVQGRNSAGAGAWSQSSSFSIESPIVIPSDETVPYSDTLETTQAKWTASPSLWRYVNDSTKAHSGTHSWWYQNTYGNYDNSTPNSGSLTSPPILIPGTGYFLRFYYRYQTETQGATWDQRWVQISQDDGPFLNLAQLYNDVQSQETSSWLASKAIDLSAYAGHSIRVRFQFSSLDAAANTYAGWGIDDFSVTATQPPGCSDSRQDDTPAQAFLLTYDPTITVLGGICPNGDFDYYKFYGNAGDRIVADIDAMINGSLLDSYLYLLDSDGQTVLAENDDEVYSQKRDPLLSYSLPKNGLYYLKLRAWKHPLLGGDSYFYTIRLYEDHINPAASLSWPLSGSYLPDGKMTLTASVTDNNNRINRVEFYWYSNDRVAGAWELLGTDSDGSNGWSQLFDPAGQVEGNSAVLYIKAYDYAGNWSGAIAWNLGIDKTAPVTALKSLPTTQPSNAFLVEWSASDNLSGIDYVEIKERKNDGEWTTTPKIDGSNSRYWIIGEPGNTYSYLMHGVDHSGNAEAYPTTAETFTSIPTADVLCFAPDSYDTSGNDNSPAKASTIYLNEASQIHNYCNPLTPDRTNDEDWVKLEAVQGQPYQIQSIPNSPQTASVIGLYAQDGITLIKEAAAQALGDETYLLWTADSNRTVYIRMHHMNGSVIGSDVKYTLSVRIPNLMYFPMVNK